MSTKEQAREAGREWAEREASLAEDQGRAVAGPWTCSWRDALPLVDEDPDAADDREELAELANDAATERWAELARGVS